MSVVPDPDLVRRIAVTTGLAPSEATRVIEDVLAFYGETTERFVRRRHAELQADGHKNPQIFALIADELCHRPVAAPELSERQLRRLVCG